MYYMCNCGLNTIQFNILIMLIKLKQLDYQFTNSYIIKMRILLCDEWALYYCLRTLDEGTFPISSLYHNLILGTIIVSACIKLGAGI